MYSLKQDARHGKSPWPDEGMSRNHQHWQQCPMPILRE